jgi:hypothetical protein
MRSGADDPKAEHRESVDRDVQGTRGVGRALIFSGSGKTPIPTFTSISKPKRVREAAVA